MNAETNLTENILRLIFERKTVKVQLAKDLGLSYPTLHKYLRGDWAIPSNVLIDIARYYNVSVGSLFGETSFVPAENTQQQIEELKKSFEELNQKFANYLQINQQN